MRDAAYGALLRLAIAPEEKSQEVETTLAVEMMQGGGMLLDTPETLLLRVSHHGHDPLPTVEIRLVGSVEYDVESPNPLLLTQVLPQVRRDVAFQLRAKVAHRIALNDKVNTA